MSPASIYNALNHRKVHRSCFAGCRTQTLDFLGTRDFPWLHVTDTCLRRVAREERSTCYDRLSTIERAAANGLSQLTAPLLLVTLTVLAIVVLLWLGKLWAHRQVSRWCEREGYELVTFRGAWFYEGPRAWLRTEDEDAYHVEVRDRQGLTRTGYVVFGTWWHPFSSKVRVEWD